jgi:enterochelin esterase-like enzyme
MNSRSEAASSAAAGLTGMTSGMTRRELLLVAAQAVATAPLLTSSARAQAPPAEPSAAELSVLETQWIDPIREAPGPTTFQLFPTPSRGPDTQGSYRLYLPPSYATDTAKRYPVLYWLHGGFGTSREGLPAVSRIDRLVRAGLMPETIVVLPHALPVGWYCDSKDGARPVEQVMTYDLVRHVDSTYRSLAEPRFRWLEGMSMGGFGTLHLGLKHPEVFGRLSAVAAAILHDMSLEPAIRTADTFSGDEAYFKAVGPWTLALANCPKLRKVSQVRVLSGGADTRLVGVLREFSQLLQSLAIPQIFGEVPGAGHDYMQIVNGIGDAPYSAFWKLEKS